MFFIELLIKIFIRVAFRPKYRLLDGATMPCRDEKPRIYIANHTAYWDALFFIGSLGCRPSLLTARDWCEKKSIGWILKGYGCVPCDRFGLDTAWLRDAAACLKNGRSIAIFPEGHTRRDGELNEFKSGFAMLAAMTGCEVVACGISGRYKFGKRTCCVIDAPKMLDRRKAMDAAYLRDESAKARLRVKELKSMAADDAAG